MTAKRWAALGIAAVLFVFSVGINFMSNVASTNFEDTFSNLMATGEFFY